MQTWVVEGSTEQRLIDAAAVAGLVEAIGSPDSEALARCMLEAAWPQLGASLCTVFAHEDRRNPRLLSGAAQQGPWIAFRTGGLHARDFSSQDPVREVLERKPEAGPVGAVIVCRQRADTMPRDSLRSECMDALGLADRLTILVRTGPACWLAAHLYRQTHYSPEQIEGFMGIARLLARCMARHYACDVDGLASLRGNLSEGVFELGSRLTEREREVLTRILDGVTVNRIAEDLKLRPTTVATYRMRAYEKLGVQSRQELFAAIMRQRPSPALGGLGNPPRGPVHNPDRQMNAA